MTTTLLNTPAAGPREVPVEAGRARDRWGTVRQLLRRPVFLIAAAYVLFVVVSAFLPSWFTSWGPFDTYPESAFLPPSSEHLFGTDIYGRDLWTRVLHGSPLTIKATLLALGIAVVAGLSLGIVSGFFGGRTDALLMRFVDVLLAIPGLLLALSGLRLI